MALYLTEDMLEHMREAARQLAEAEALADEIKDSGTYSRLLMPTAPQYGDYGTEIRKWVRTTARHSRKGLSELQVLLKRLGEEA
jgi:hypothetical protein